MLQGCVFPQDGVGVAAHHVVDGFHDGQHLLEDRGLHELLPLRLGVSSVTSKGQATTRAAVSAFEVPGSYRVSWLLLSGDSQEIFMYLSPKEEAIGLFDIKLFGPNQTVCGTGWQGPKAGLRVTRPVASGEEGQADLPTQYLFGDVAILVNVVEIEGPLELLMDCPSEQDGEPDHKVL